MNKTGTRMKPLVGAGFLAGMALSALMWTVGHAVPGSDLRNGSLGEAPFRVANRTEPGNFGAREHGLALGEPAAAHHPVHRDATRDPAEQGQRGEVSETPQPESRDGRRDNTVRETLRDDAESGRAGAVQGMPPNGERSGEQNGPVAADVEQPAVAVYLTAQRKTETVPLETYVMGVVAAEMPADFPPAALEAQALAARTYIVRRLRMEDRSGVPAGAADVTDTTKHQVYRSQAHMRAMKENDPEGWENVRRAVEATAGRVLVYDGEPIQALYFSTSNGYTEASEEVFPFALPYLRSVASPWDKSGAPRSEERTEMGLADFYGRLGVRVTAAMIKRGKVPELRIAAWTQGRRVKTLLVGDRKFSGEEVREKLGLRSTAFSWKIEGDRIVITTRGSGHGVGMSQWGARGMAEAGYTAEQIVKHYYPGVSIAEVSKL